MEGKHYRLHRQDLPRLLQYLIWNNHRFANFCQRRGITKFGQAKIFFAMADKWFIIREANIFEQ